INHRCWSAPPDVLVRQTCGTSSELFLGPGSHPSLDRRKKQDKTGQQHYLVLPPDEPIEPPLCNLEPPPCLLRRQHQAEPGQVHIPALQIFDTTLLPLPGPSLYRHHNNTHHQDRTGPQTAPDWLPAETI